MPTLKLTGARALFPLILAQPVGVCRAWPGCYMVMNGIVTQISGKVQPQADGAEG